MQEQDLIIASLRMYLVTVFYLFFKPHLFLHTYFILFFFLDKGVGDRERALTDQWQPFKTLRSLPGMVVAAELERKIPLWARRGEPRPPWSRATVRFATQPTRLCSAQNRRFSPLWVWESNAVREVDEQIDWSRRGEESTGWTDCGISQQYLQAYVMEKLFPILTISTCGTSLGISWWWERAKRKTSYSCDSVGNNPPVDQRIIGS